MSLSLTLLKPIQTTVLLYCVLVVNISLESLEFLGWNMWFVKMEGGKIPSITEAEICMLITLELLESFLSQRIGEKQFQIAM